VLTAPKTAPVRGFIRVANINRAGYPGSFVIRTSIELPNGEFGEIGREPVLSRWSVAGCANCQDKLEEEAYVPVDDKTLAWVKGTRNRTDVKFKVDIQKGDAGGLLVPTPDVPEPTAGWM
jgi:hypothetical protein